MTTPDLPEDDDPAAFERVRFALEGLALVQLLLIAQQGRAGERRMSDDERAVVAAALSVPSVPYNRNWRFNAPLAGCRHEPETLEAIAQLQAIDAAIDASMAAFDAAWSEASKCREPLKDSDPTD